MSFDVLQREWVINGKKACNLTNLIMQVGVTPKLALASTGAGSWGLQLVLPVVSESDVLEPGRCPF
jgi:hypothetical protein